MTGVPRRATQSNLRLPGAGKLSTFWRVLEPAVWITFMGLCVLRVVVYLFQVW